MTLTPSILKKTQLTAGVTLVVAYTYTLADRLASLTYPSGAIVSYVRDAVGRIVQVKRKVDAASANVTIVSNASWNPFGPLNTLTYGNGRTLTKSYDQDYAIDKVASSDPNGLVLDFSTDVMGNIKDASNSVGPAVKTRKYLYDNLYRLSRVDTGSDVLVEDYAYNKTGDRTLKQLGAQAPQVYTYLVGTHRLGSVDGTSRDYDSNGNMRSINSGRAHPEFMFGERNRMNASLFNGRVQASYSLSGRGERVAKLDPQGKNSRVYAYDEAGHLLGDYPTTEKLFTGDENLYLDDMPVATTIGGALSYLETDHLGTPRIAANSSTNAQQWKWDFFGDAFGGNAATIAPSGGIDVKLRYPGQYFDGEMGLHYNYFRDYEAGTGRYVESDPIGLVAGIGTYLYVESTPFMYSDPRGTEAVGYGARNGWGAPTQAETQQRKCGIDAFNRNYQDMLSANTIGADRYFHCKANCEAAKCGRGGYDMACTISDGRELSDTYVKYPYKRARGVQGAPTHTAALADSAADQAANEYGRNSMASGTSCKITCSKFRPNGLDQSY